MAVARVVVTTVSTLVVWAVAVVISLPVISVAAAVVPDCSVMPTAVCASSV